MLAGRCVHCSRGGHDVQRLARNARRAATAATGDGPSAIRAGQPIPQVRLAGLPAQVTGLWSLWCIHLHSQRQSRRRILAAFLHDDGRSLSSTARNIWELLLRTTPAVSGYVDGVAAAERLARVQAAAEEAGQVVFQTLQQDHQAALNRDRSRGEQAFAARRIAAERIGLPAVRMHRLTLLDEERQVWRETLVRDEETLPELVPLLILRVEAEAAHG